LDVAAKRQKGAGHPAKIDVIRNIAQPRPSSTIRAFASSRGS
jgi:hypothetical protein